MTEMVLFGGGGGSAYTEVLLNDTWTWKQT